MITNAVVREDIVARIEAAKANKRFATTGERAYWLRKDERAIGIVGGFRFSVRLARKVSRGGTGEGLSQMMLFFYGAEAVLSHEEFATPEAVQWFYEAFARGDRKSH